MHILDASSYHRLETVAGVIVPAFAELSETDRAEFRAIIEKALAERPPAVVKQLSLFLKVVNLAPIFRWGRPLSKLPDDAAHRALLWFQESPIGRLRQGFWGLRTIVFMGFYGRVASWADIGYGPELDGRGGLDA